MTTVELHLHVGAFTPEGTFDDAAARLPELKQLGVTLLYQRGSFAVALNLGPPTEVRLPAGHWWYPLLDTGARVSERSVQLPSDGLAILGSGPR